MATTATDAAVAAVDNGHGWRLRTNVMDALMAAKGLTTRTAQAEAIGLHRSHWSGICNGRETSLTLATAMRVAQVAGTTVEVLFERVPDA